MSIEQFTKNPCEAKCCINCRHFLPYVYEYDDSSDHWDAEYGECRRYPPKPVPAEECGFPIVEHSMWCGEFDF